VCKLQAGQQCDENPQAPWIPRCRNHTECIPAGYNFKTACVCSDGWTGEHCQDPVGDISTDPPIEKNPEQEDKVDDPIENKTIDYFEEMDEMLKEIINHRYAKYTYEYKALKYRMSLYTLFPFLLLEIFS
jgi:hypothetical protein